MGKTGRPRLSTTKNAKRWKRGQSSSCNPETTKFRDQVKFGSFQRNRAASSSLLTTDVLRKHDAIQGLPPAEQIEVDEDEGTVASTFKTFDTFASDYSNCSNESFGRFLNHFQSSSLIHKEMLAVLAAVTDVIKQNGGTESSTEYYGALMTTLETVDSEESVAAILSLLGMGLKTVPKNVLKKQFSQASHTFFQLLTKYAGTENFLIIRHCIGCLSLLLRAQEAIMWTNASTLQVLDGILAFTVHAKPKVRKAAQHAVCAILKGSDIMRAENPPPCHPAATQVAKHCLARLENIGQPGSLTTALHVLTMLKDIAHQLPKSQVKSVCEAILRIMTINQPLVTSCCLQTLHSLFVSYPPESVLPAQLNAQIINALYDYQPSPGDIKPTLGWLAVMQEAHINLVDNNVELCAANIPRIIDKSTKLWLSDKIEVVTAASQTIKTLLQVCIAPLCETDANAKKYKTTLSKVFYLIQSAIMQYQFNEAWHHVLHILAILFQVAGQTCKEELAPILVDLANLRNSHKFTYNSEIEYAVGAAVKFMGPEIVLKTIPLHTNDQDVIDLKRSWLLPVLKDCTTKASLQYFIENLLPLAMMCETKATECKAKNNGIQAHSFELLTSQIWALLPSFCTNPNDIKQSFKSIARLLGTAISSRKNLRFSAMSSLRKLITRAKENCNKEDIEELARFSKNYLPLLFNLYTTKPNGTDEEGHRLAAFDTIKVYLTITDKDMIGELFDKALARLDEPDIDDFLKQTIFDLIRTLTQFTDVDRVKMLYEKCVPLLMNSKHHKEQKKAYRFLEEICGSESEVCKEFVEENRDAIQELLTKASPMTASSSKAARVRCLDHLIKTHPNAENTEFLKSLVPEIVHCTKEVNQKCRNSAFELLNTIAYKLLENPENFKEFMDILIAGLGGTPSYCSASLLALASITYKFTGILGLQNIKVILGHTCTLLTSPTREIVLSALSFIKVYLSSSFPITVIGPTLPQIVKALTDMTDDCKRHFRQKVRDILVKLVRRYGIETITGLVPKSDELMHKRLRNIRKIETRKQNAREDGKKTKNKEEDEMKRRPKNVDEILAEIDEDFEEAENEDDEEPQKKSNKRKTWIQEGAGEIVNFMDPTAARTITSTKPKPPSSVQVTKKKPKDYGFKTAEDGRLIIKDGSDDDDSDSGKDSNDGEESDTPSTATVPIGGRKRKLSGSTDGASVRSSKYKAGGSGIHRPIKSSKSDASGAEFRARKAKGDVKKKGGLEPFAYVPLTRASLNRRKKIKTAGRFKGVISGVKKGEGRVDRRGNLKTRGRNGKRKTH